MTQTLLNRFVSKISDLPVWTQLIILVTIPGMIALSMLSAKTVLGLQNSQEAEQLSALTKVAVAGSELVHELQKERGMSAGFIGSSGATFADKLTAQRALVDTKLEGLRSASKILNPSEHDNVFVDELTESLRRLDMLGSTRDAVSGLKITVKDAVSYFTNVNANILSAVSRLAHLPSGTSLSLNAAALAHFSNSKERAGIERAILSVIFARDKMSNEMRTRLSGLIESQSSYLYAFAGATTPQGLAKLEALRTSDEYIETERLRDLALAKGENFGVSSTYWFDTITLKINAMRSIETALATDLIAEAANLASTAYRNSRLSALLLATATICIAFICWIILSGFRTTLGEEPKNLAKMAKRLANGSFNPTDEQLEAATGLYKTLCEVQRQIDERARIRLEALERSDKLKQCLDKLNTPVLATDSNFQISYANTAMLDYLVEMNGHYASVLSQANGGEIIGSNIEIFSDNGNKPHQSLSTQNPSVVRKSTFGERIVNLSYNLVLDNDSQASGVTLEIVDITDTESLLSEVSGVVDSASRGVLDVRVTLTEKLDESKELSKKINTLIEINEDVISSIGVVMADFADGKLKAEQQDNWAGKYAEIMDNTRRANEQLIQIVSELQSSAGSVANNANEISRGIEDLRARTESSAASLESTTNSMKEIAVTVKDNAGLANQASELTSKAQEDAKYAGEIFDNAIRAMEEISASSSKIAEITSVIDEIAFQTNLLALNASVEAARAGEQGRGFAVVASEVRNLAGRSAMSAKEIKSLIEDSVQKVADGRNMVVESGESLQVILDSVDKVDRFVTDIDDASRNQATVIENIQGVMQNLSEDTQRNAALVEQASTASFSSKEEAETLLSLTDFFTIEDPKEHKLPPLVSIKDANADAA